MKRAKITNISADGINVYIDELRTEQTVQVDAIEQRITLPWKPRDLRDYLIVFRRHDSSKDDYIEDLRVRRNLIFEILKLLTRMKHWRPHAGEEPMHMYYTGFDWLTEQEIEEHFPEDAVPEELNFQDAVDDASHDGLTRNVFHEWLQEGRNDCEMARTLLHTWLHDLTTSDNDSIPDFFDALEFEFRETLDTAAAISEDCGTGVLPFSFIADFMFRTCVLPFQTKRY